MAVRSHFQGGAFSTSDRRLVTSRTVELLKTLVGATRWKNGAQLLTLLRGIGRELHAVGGFREPAIGNVVRRIMASVREEVMSSSQVSGCDRPSLESMLWAHPHARTVSRHDSFGIHANESPVDQHDDRKSLPPVFYQHRPDLKQAVMEAIQEIMSDLEDLHKIINEQATSHIHAGEVILTYGRSRTIELFLKAAAAKKRNSQAIVCEVAPHFGGHEMAKSLAKAGIDTIVVNDSAIFAVMARINKVLLPAHAVLANGGLIAPSGSNLVALAAKNNSVPVVCVTGMFKLCPQYPHEGQDTLNDLVSPASVVDYAELSNGLMKDVEFINPVHDYIEPELVNLYITNVGVFQPSYIYRLLAENYHSDDWESFE
jgi:translation initiation factor eIF-2B subunit beta